MLKIVKLLKLKYMITFFNIQEVDLHIHRTLEVNGLFATTQHRKSYFQILRFKAVPTI